MSEKAHSSNAPALPRHLWTSLAWLLPCWLLLSVLIYLLAHQGGAVLDTLARRDPDPARREKVQALLAARALLAPPGSSLTAYTPSAPPGSSPSVSEGQLLWAARSSGEASAFFLAGAVRSERLGRPADARLWLTMELLARGHPDEARTMLSSVPTSAPLTLPDLATWESSALGQRLRESLGR